MRFTKFILRTSIYTVAGIWLIASLAGCMMLAGRTFRQGYDEAQALEAINILADKYPYVDYTQIIPDTYRYELSKQRAFDKIVRQLKTSGETILEQNIKTGIIYTAAKVARLPYQDGEIDDQDKIYYQFSIFITQKSKNITYVTVYPTVLKGDYQEVVLPFTRNMLRGMFFGSLAAELYPERKRIGLTVAEKMKKVSFESKSRDRKEEIVHTVQSGETLGDIARMYTGKVMNFQKIAEYNNISDVTRICVGQKIKIPTDLQ